jgi:hypothetical protein
MAEHVHLPAHASKRRLALERERNTLWWGIEVTEEGSVKRAPAAPGYPARNESTITRKAWDGMLAKVGPTTG